MGVVVLDLAAQPVDIDLEHVALAEIVSSPHMLQQEILRDHTPGVLRQIGKDAILGGRQRDLLPAHRHQMLRKVDGRDLRWSWSHSAHARPRANCERRITARTRASSSSTLKGLVR